MNANRSTGPGVHTADGCAVDLYRLLAPRGEAEIITAAIPPGCAVLELGAGAGRVTHRLIEFGHAVWAVDASAEMLAAITGATTICAEIAGLDLGRRFASVVLGSHLVNTVGTDSREALLQTCARHVEPDGLVLVEAHAISALERFRPGPIGIDENGVACTWLDVRRAGTVISATIEYRHGDDVWTHHFSTRILDRRALSKEFARCGLRLERALSETWYAAALE